jgi:transcription termination/antitermination protein NusA
MNGELLRIIDTIHRDRDIDKEVLFEGIETALLTAARRKYGTGETLRVEIDRSSGAVRAFDGSRELKVDFGRIAAQTAKQVIIQKIREAEQDVIYDGFEDRKGQLITGSIQRIEGGTLVVNLGNKAEGYIPRHEQIRGETYHVGDRIRCYVLDVKKVGSKVKIILTRSHPDFIAKLFALEVPEVAEKLVVLRRLVREAGYKTKIAVESVVDKVDAIGACVGVRGTRIKNIIEEVGGEKIDIIRYSDDPTELIVNALKPATVNSITLDPDNTKAWVTVDEDQLSLAIGRRGQNVRLAARLTEWDIDIMTDEEAEKRHIIPSADVEEVAYLGKDGETVATTPIEEEGVPDTEAPEEAPTEDAVPETAEEAEEAPAEDTLPETAEEAPTEDTLPETAEEAPTEDAVPETAEETEPVAESPEAPAEEDSPAAEEAPEEAASEPKPYTKPEAEKADAPAEIAAEAKPEAEKTDQPQEGTPTEDSGAEDASPRLDPGVVEETDR